GAVGSGLGAYISIALGPMPTGPVIVLTLCTIFLVSLLAAPRRSLIGRLLARRRAREQLRAELCAPTDHGCPARVGARRTVPSGEGGTRCASCWEPVRWRGSPRWPALCPVCSWGCGRTRCWSLRS